MKIPRQKLEHLSSAVLERTMRPIRSIRRFRRPKVFCVGRNKTGTTSIGRALSDLGYRVGDQRRAERLLYHYRDRNFEPIIEFCFTADAFQDFPFGAPYTYVALDQAFPGSKFILTVRDPDEWYDSYVRHQKKVMGTAELPTADQLREHPYVWKGWLYEIKICLGRSENDLYDPVLLKQQMLEHNRSVREYFRFRNNLLVLDVSTPDAYTRMCTFLSKEPLYERMPWENRTR